MVETGGCGLLPAQRTARSGLGGQRLGGQVRPLGPRMVARCSAGGAAGALASCAVHGMGGRCTSSAPARSAPSSPRHRPAPGDQVQPGRPAPAGAGQEADARRRQRHPLQADSGTLLCVSCAAAPRQPCRMCLIGCGKLTSGRWRPTRSARSARSASRPRRPAAHPAALLLTCSPLCLRRWPWAATARSTWPMATATSASPSLTPPATLSGSSRCPGTMA